MWLILQLPLSSEVFEGPEFSEIVWEEMEPLSRHRVLFLLTLTWVTKSKGSPGNPEPCDGAQWGFFPSLWQWECSRYGHWEYFGDSAFYIHVTQTVVLKSWSLFSEIAAWQLKSEFFWGSCKTCPSPPTTGDIVVYLGRFKVNDECWG